jgi:hypothetical protein
VFVQRRTANRLSGWVAYSYGKAALNDGLLGQRFAADYDMRHGVQAFGTLRITPTVNLSGRYVFGTGLPVVGFYRGTEGDLWVAAARNQVRLPLYQRADLRINKSWRKDHYRLTLFCEIVNLWNQRNVRASELQSLDARTGKVRINYDRMFPILPSAGVLFEL